jgi:hypothetical protein
MAMGRPDRTRVDGMVHKLAVYIRCWFLKTSKAERRYMKLALNQSGFSVYVHLINQFSTYCNSTPSS